jgi:ribosome biogenesis protein ERB1
MAKKKNHRSKKVPPTKEEEEEEPMPDIDPADSGSSEDDDGADDDDSASVYDSDVPDYEGSGSEDDDGDSSSDDDGFEDQGSSDEDEDLLEEQRKDDDSVDEMDKIDDIEKMYEKVPRQFKSAKRTNKGEEKPKEGADLWMHTDDLSSDDEDAEGVGNRIGRVPLHWYEEYDHIGYDAHGKKVIKTSSLEGGDRVDQAIANADNMQAGKFVVHDALNDKNVELSARQLELIRRIQNGAYAHPEFDGNAEYIDYFSGVDQEVSGLSADRYLPKSKFQPSKWEKMQIDSLIDKLNRGVITMDFLTGKVRDLSQAMKKNKDPDGPFMLWDGTEEDELNLRKGPQHIAAPKVAPPGHAESYIPPDEYLPTEEDLKKWEDLDVKDRPHGLLVPKKFPNLRSVGAYEHSVRETFERCLDLYLCPRVMKKRLNIDPESLVPQLPKASDLRPFPTAKCIAYKTPFDNEAPIIRCVTPSPGGQFMASGATDGFVRLWEVETGRLLRSWDLSALADDDSQEDGCKPVVALEWNPNRSHHCMIAAVGTCAVIIATGTEGSQDVEITDALLTSARKGGNVTNPKAAKVVKWTAVEESDKPISSFASKCGPVCVLRTTREMAGVRWHAKGDYFVSVSPKAGAAAVLIHQLSKGNSQQPFSKAKGESQCACFHPNKPFLFVASQQHVRIYHLVKQAMVKRLISGCRWISSIDVHHSGDHLIVGSLDRRMIWFDLDLASTPYKTLKYHERALRSVQMHNRYPLMASASDDGTIHVFHSMVYSDLMRNPLIVPVKILRGHTVTKKLGVLTVAFHPNQPWIFSGGADGKIILFQDI